ncbi:hypothetical protein PPTG_02175 [Phytophthora nicotianae INRA-310]|uniref:Uncharacterized protein n=1 Tax=Phytophthora nicotianae (strain INRA-310) TaxID=761204 RepID=W2R9R1_PHYN3|nr:hypothetical protein PPTG_02175 [Phytophthora nicotianae INRA-310]ETN22153.1 hypothetical protein PPTG_02175 [Phytophthora nicotianae INRA-310]
MGRKKARTSVSTPYTAIQQSGSSSKLSRSTPFQDRHLLEFGLKISERNPESEVVFAVARRFCISFGRDEKVGSKRKQTANTKYFKLPFRPEQYRSHLTGQHLNRWEHYLKLSTDAQNVYFDELQSFRSSIHSFVNENQAPVVTCIDRDIVDKIVGQILLDDDDEDSAWTRAKRSNLDLS